MKVYNTDPIDSRIKGNLSSSDLKIFGTYIAVLMTITIGNWVRPSPDIQIYFIVVVTLFQHSEDRYKSSTVGRRYEAHTNAGGREQFYSKTSRPLSAAAGTMPMTTLEAKSRGEIPLPDWRTFEGVAPLSLGIVLQFLLTEVLDNQQLVILSA